jgi:hypothetical protein
MQSVKVKGFDKLDGAIDPLLGNLPVARRVLRDSLEEIMRNYPNEAHAESAAVQEAQKFAVKVADRLEGVS